MEAIGAIIQAIMFFFGIYEEHQVTREQCEQMWSLGYVAYPLTQEQYNRIEQCKELIYDGEP